VDTSVDTNSSLVTGKEVAEFDLGRPSCKTYLGRVESPFKLKGPYS
jgi:hypothetical protein